MMGGRPGQHMRLSSKDEKAMLDPILEDSSHVSTFRRRKQSRTSQMLSGVILMCLMTIICAVTYTYGPYHSLASSPDPERTSASYDPSQRSDPTTLHGTHQTIYNRPAGLKIVGLIFYGRRRFAEILDCYLRRNLAIHGGLLDEVQFIMHARNETDTAWAEAKIGSSSDYYKTVEVPEHCGDTYGCMWELATDENTLYIKIDDDIAWIEDSAIRRLVQARIDNPEAWGISANIINTPLMTQAHYRYGAIHPWAPQNYNESADDNPIIPKGTWKPSQLPSYVGNPEKDIQNVYPPIPFQGHTWLPIRQSPLDLLWTPIGRAFLDPLNFDMLEQVWHSWAAAAQNHFSLLQNIEEGTTDKYYAGALHVPASEPPSRDTVATGTTTPPRTEPGFIYHPQWQRHNLNFFAIYGRDVKSRLPIFLDDEYAMTIGLPRLTGRPHLVAMGAVAAHYNFFAQSVDLASTDTLERYKAYANDRLRCGV